MPPFHCYYVQLAIYVEVFLEELSEFARRHPMPGWNRKLSHKRCELRLKNITCHLRTVYWIRTITDDYPFTCSLGGPHAVGHRVDKGVNPTTDVLHIKNQNIDIG